MNKKLSIRRWYGCRSHAKENNQDFCTKEEMERFWETPHICAYCGIKEEDWLKQHKRNLEIDRKDNTKGYIFDNITWACRRCNMIKNNFFSYKEMKEIAEKYISPKLDHNQ